MIFTVKDLQLKAQEARSQSQRKKALKQVTSSMEAATPQGLCLKFMSIDHEE